MTEILRSTFIRIRSGKHTVFFAVTATAILFSLVTVYWQARTLGLPYLEEWTQIQRHNAVLQGTAGDPWQYRVLAEYIAEGFIQILKGWNLPHAIAVAFIIFRLLQNLLIFFAAFYYYRRLRLSTAQGLMGLCILSWSMTNSLYNSDLSFNTYFDILFYLLAALAILHEKPFWIIPLSVLAAFNRETGGLIPLMLLAAQYRAAPGKQKNFSIAAAVLSLGLFLAILFGLRLLYGPQELVLAYNGLTPGFSLLAYNLFRPITWETMILTLGILPILAVFSYSRWPRGLKVFFWVVVPVWFLVHPFIAILAESRLFLVPQALVFIPGALLLIAATDSQPSDGGRATSGNNLIRSPEAPRAP
jgi:hypothetical protein